MNDEAALILYIDDVRDNLLLVERFLASDYRVITAENGSDGLEKAREEKPALILLDIMMPGMDGYEVCSALQSDEGTAYIPVVFVTALGEEKDKARAFSVGAADYLVKPIRKQLLVEKIEKHLRTNEQWNQIQKRAESWLEKVQPSDFLQFKDFLCDKIKVASEARFRMSSAQPSGIYKAASDLGISEENLAQYMAGFTGLPYSANINPEDIELGVLPAAFCRSNHVIAMETPKEGKAFVLSNPFDMELMDTLAGHFHLGKSSSVSITHPRNITALLSESSINIKDAHFKGSGGAKDGKKVIDSLSGIEIAGQDSPVVKITNSILNSAVRERASDIHIEPKDRETVVRFRIDGDLRNAFNLKPRTGVMVISRLKIIGGMDIAEKRKPQDGGFVAELSGRTFNLRLSTTSTPYGESLVMRLLEPYAEPKKLEELGMLKTQSRTLVRVANKTSGIILLVGSTGSGKTTTIYSLLHNIDHEKRSLMSVEDPVEYRMPFVNQQQVNEKAGVTFEALLKTAVRQDPDVLFMGEIRDTFSARIAIDFASTGHLTISTLHTSNATSAIFRLGRLGIERGIIASSVLAIVAQKLIKKLCPHCKKIVTISESEAEMFRTFTDDIPARVAHPVGCEKCSNTGYLGREGVYEVLEFDREVSDLLNSEASVAEIREFVRGRGDFLISTHGIYKAGNLTVSPEDVYRKVLAEELTEIDLLPEDDPTPGSRPVEVEEEQPVDLVEPAVLAPGRTVGKGEGGRVASSKESRTPSILVVEDDEDTRKLITRFLESEGYQVFSAGDGVEALLQLGSRDFDLVLSDVDMPNLDGFKLLEMMAQKRLDYPVILLTSRDDPGDEEMGLELGAMDYIRKPIKRELLLLRVRRTLQSGR